MCGIEAATVAWELLGWEPMCFAELNEFPSTVLAEWYPKVPNVGNVTKVKWTCARCGKTYRNLFFKSYPREFWKDNKKRVGEVCEKCYYEIDYSNVQEELK